MFMFNMSLESKCTPICILVNVIVARVFYTSEQTSAYGLPTNTSLVVAAAKPIWLQDDKGAYLYTV
jgi:hypothetical protein